VVATSSDRSKEIWALVERQHGVVAHRQLLALGLTSSAIRHRVATGRLHPKARGVYAVGRPGLSPEGELMVAVLACGEDAYVGGVSAAALYTIGPATTAGSAVEIVMAGERRCRVAGVRARGCRLAPEDRGEFRRVPVTSPARTLVDLAPRLSEEALERAVNLADSLDLVDPEALRAACERLSPRPGAARLRRLLDRRTFRLSDSVLEQRFLRIAARAGLPIPETQRRVDGFRTDFVWPALGLVVETDSLRYHRTPAQQYRDRRRDQAHHLAGRVPLRFTHAQVSFEAAYAEQVLRSFKEAAA
jgi:very-short-patch-repair endonuclease